MLLMPLKTIDYPLKTVSNHSSGSAQTAQRWHQPSNPLNLCYFSGTTRDSRRHKMPIQRLAPSVPPVNSAEVLQIVQFLLNLQHFPHISHFVEIYTLDI